MRLSSVAAATASLGLLIGAQQASSETLSDAVQSAYETNPAFLERQADQRVLDETYVQARAGWRPTLGAQATVSENREDLGSGNGSELLTDATGHLVAIPGGGSFNFNSGNAVLQASQPLYTGGRVRSAVDAAEADILAGRADLRNAEIQLLQTVIQTYADVRRNLEVVAVNQDDIGVLERQLAQSQAKVDLGQADQVDLAQSRAQLANAHAQLSTAQGRLRISAAAFTTIVGHVPSDLAPSDKLPNLPVSLDEAFTDAEAESPVLQRAVYAGQAARFRVAEARAATRPTAAANLSVGYTGAVAPFATDRFDRAIAGTLSFTVPIYSGGVVSSQIRQALERDTAGRLALENARRTVVQNVSQAWSEMDAASANVASNTEQVKAAELAFEGLQAQNRFGTATTLDLLIQHQQFRLAQLALIQARYDVFVAQANVLAAVGRLSAARIAPNTALYDPQRAFDKVDRSSRFPLEVIPSTLDRIGAPHP